MFNEGGKMTGTKYELPTDTITAAIKLIPKDKWRVFCDELHTYMVEHSEAVEALQVLADLGMIEFQHPKTFTWVDDGKDEVLLKAKVTVV